MSDPAFATVLPRFVICVLAPKPNFGKFAAFATPSKPSPTTLPTPAPTVPAAKSFIAAMPSTGVVFTSPRSGLPFARAHRRQYPQRIALCPQRQRLIQQNNPLRFSLSEKGVWTIEPLSGRQVGGFRNSRDYSGYALSDPFPHPVTAFGPIAINPFHNEFACELIFLSS